MIGVQQLQPAQWPSIDDAKPPDQGGTDARIGFNYQDEVAVGFLIEILADPAITKIQLETHDDIVLIRAADPSSTAEYIQVKAAEKDKLWSAADLCRREKGEGSSIFEKSLARDCHHEISRFRLVTLRPVVDELKVLSIPPRMTGREPCSGPFLALHNELLKRCPGVHSPKSNGPSYWLHHCYWDVRHDEKTLRESNLLQLLRLSHAERKLLILEQAELLLDELRSLAKSAAAARWEPDPTVKIITRDQLRSWWDTRAADLLHGARSESGGKLTVKMQAAGLAEDQIRMALELRRDYARAIRTSKYMDDGEMPRLQSRVISELVLLRAKFVAGQLNLNSAGFHSLCIERMMAIACGPGTSGEDHAGFSIGCMYDIADRCLHQFASHSP